jgi:hypothetical protein
MPHRPLDRRRFLTLLGGLGATIGAPRLLRATTPHRHHSCGRCPGPHVPGPHPEPRKNYKPTKVLTAEELDGDKELIELFDGVREHSTVIDGIRCHCGCAGTEGMYSLLSCYERDNPMQAMSKWCPICQGQGRLTIRLAKQGKTLDEIRKAIDARY